KHLIYLIVINHTINSLLLNIAIFQKVYSKMIFSSWLPFADFLFLSPYLQLAAAFHSFRSSFLVGSLPFFYKLLILLELLAIVPSYSVTFFLVALQSTLNDLFFYRSYE